MKGTAMVALAAAAMLVSGGSGVQAGAGHGAGGRFLERVDLNRDGAITREEAGTMRTARFLRWDRDGDGAITEEEMMAAAQERMARRIGKAFARMDLNGDGRVARAEFEEAGAERFARMDRDGDGRLSVEEIKARRHGWGRDRGAGTEGGDRPSE